MIKYKTTIQEVMSDDPNSPFWQRMVNSPGYERFVDDLDYIMSQSEKHGQPFNQIDPKDLDPYDWSLYGPTHS